MRATETNTQPQTERETTMQTERLHHAATTAKAKRMTGDDLAFTMKDAQEASEAAQAIDAAGGHAPKLDWYADEVLIYGAEIAKRERTAELRRSERTGRPMGPKARATADLKAAVLALTENQSLWDTIIEGDNEGVEAMTAASENLQKASNAAKALGWV